MYNIILIVQSVIPFSSFYVNNHGHLERHALRYAKSFWRAMSSLSRGQCQVFLEGDVKAFYRAMSSLSRGRYLGLSF